MNVLIFPAGTEIGREIWLSLRYVKEMNLFLGGAHYENHALYYNQEYFVLPSVNESNWLSELQKCIAENKIDYIFPAHDDAIVALVNQRENINAVVLSPEVDVCNITRSKTSTYRLFEDVIRVPKIFSETDEISYWPVFVKPDRGQGSQGAMRVETSEQLAILLKKTPENIICEYLPGEEFTVDCFSDRKKGLLFCQPRTRERIRNGIAMSSTIVELEGIGDIAQKISAKLSLRGAWFFQVKRSASGELVLLEIAPRIAGTMALNRARGINFPLLTIYESQLTDVGLYALPGNVKISRGLINRYRTDIIWQHVYVDFDDTIIINGNLNLSLIQFLYQAVNAKQTITLISRHKGDLHAELEKWRIGSLFDQVIHLTSDEKKSQFITHYSSIFIDDSFAERSEVHQRTGIPVFDTSMVELLINE
ncbi:ATP-grasp enzyme-like protein [Buttiauxella noackiae ATCC 51607]|uniref:ATP-grasp enzyme-like protein n=1 Tax=Buttiauxella noackiae ATCC 51607 TaxID=1354255 RepID=A0A1B7HM80_9ENTR|nr:ATP-grasp domain-containing protein [Buttiauxella noackiae]OAT16715.1 ATP-grasp enzyme-like protein [Buttiauxella noackiae ATCC 51607]